MKDRISEEWQKEWDIQEELAIQRRSYQYKEGDIAWKREFILGSFFYTPVKIVKVLRRLRYKCQEPGGKVKKVEQYHLYDVKPEAE